MDDKIFWDVNLAKNGKEAPFIIGRILEYGDPDDIKWMFKKFKKSQIKQTVLKNKNISPKSANFWALFFGVPKNKILCLKPSYRKMRKSHWPY